MAAVGCELLLPNGNPCGVQAVGRCLYCGKAFCWSHQVRYDIHSITASFIDLRACCQECLARMDAQVAQQAADRMRPIQEAVTYFNSGAAQREFRARGVSSVELLAVSNDYCSRLGGFLGGGWVEHVTSAGRGWLLGEFTWKSTTSRHFEDTEHFVKRPTVLIDTVTPSWSGSPVTTVLRHGAAYELCELWAVQWEAKPTSVTPYEVQLPPDELEEWEEAYRSAKKLVEP